MKSLLPRHGGFTLVEIMVVVVIVGLLSTLSVAGITRIKHKTQDTMVLNTLRQIYDAKEMYLTQEGRPFATYSRLVREGYLSHSIVAATEHNLGAWPTTGLRTISYKQGESIKLTERTKSGNRINFGRVIEYPGSTP